jgi:hypothetical protein
MMRRPIEAKVAAEPYLAAVYAQDIKNAEAQQKHNQEIAWSLLAQGAGQRKNPSSQIQQLAAGGPSFDALTTGERVKALGALAPLGTISTR